MMSVWKRWSGQEGCSGETQIHGIYSCSPRVVGQNMNVARVHSVK